MNNICAGNHYRSPLYIYIMIDNLCCNLVGSVKKSAALIVRYSQKKEWISIVFYCSNYPSIAHNLGTTGLIQVGFLPKCTSSNEELNQIENWKCNMCNFRLIPLDRIAFCVISSQTRHVNFSQSLIFFSLSEALSLKVLNSSATHSIQWLLPKG